MNADALSSQLVATGQGSEQAFGELYDATSARVYSLLLRRTGSPVHAADLTHFVYVAMWQQASRYDPRTQHALTWVVAFAYHQALRQVRPDDALPLCPHAMFGYVDSSSATCEVCGPTSRQLQLRREILTLHFLGGCLDTEVADTLGVPEATVISTVAEGLLLMRAYESDSSGSVSSGSGSVGDQISAGASTASARSELPSPTPWAIA